ncbi:MAG: serine/threonine-protein kinase [Gemmatimonadales bacterium]
MSAFRAELADRYRLLDYRTGGMATVYRADDLQRGTQVAIKVLRPEFAAALGGPRFAREVHIAATLQHPNIVPLLDSGTAAGRAYYVMPVVEGESLAGRLQRETRLTIEEALRLAVEVADALAHAHAAGFVHRDIKPGNILLSHGHAVVADFGVARALEVTGAERLTESGMALGTAAYMSPEQASGERVHGRATSTPRLRPLRRPRGCPAIHRPDGTIDHGLNAGPPVPSIRTVRPTVPPALEAVLNRALAKVPQDRFANATEFRNALVRPDVAATAPAVTGRGRRASWLRPLAAVVAVAGLAAVAYSVRDRFGGADLDRNRVMVYPLLTPEDWTGPKSAGEDVATVIGSAMDGAGSVRWVDGWHLLGPAERDNVRKLTAVEAMAIARRQRCAWVVMGRLFPRGDSADVFLELYDVAGETLVARPQGKIAAIQETWRGGMRAVPELLTHLIPAGIPDVEAEWQARPPQAVAHFLLGEAAFRRLQLPGSLAEFRKAIEADSGFSLAAVRGAQVASWSHEPEEAAELIGVATRGNLSPRYRLLAEGFQAYLAGSADSAAARFRAAVVLDPGLVAGWMQLGEVYMHLLPMTGQTDSSAEAAFVRARALDSTAATLQFHLVEILARRGDEAGAATLAREFARVSADTMLRREVELIAGCRNATMRGADLREVAARQPLPLLVAGKSLGSSTTTEPCARQSFAALLEVDTARTEAADSRRFFALVGLVNGLLNQGRVDTVVAVIERFQERWGYGRSLYLLAGPVAPALADSARSVARQDSVSGGADYHGVEFPRRLWELGVWAAVDGRPATARAVAGNLAARSRQGGRLDTLLALSAAAHATLAEGDSAGALAQFERALALGAPAADLAWDEVASMGFDRLILGGLLLRRNAAARALAVLEVHDSAVPAIYPLYSGPSLRLRAEAAQALNDPARATALRSRLAARQAAAR